MMKMIDHIGIVVSNYSQSKFFYVEILKVLGYGSRGQDCANIHKNRPRSPVAHAFLPLCMKGGV